MRAERSRPEADPTRGGPDPTPSLARTHPVPTQTRTVALWLLGPPRGGGAHDARGRCIRRRARTFAGSAYEL